MIFIYINPSNNLDHQTARKGESLTINSEVVSFDVLINSFAQKGRRNGLHPYAEGLYFETNPGDNGSPSLNFYQFKAIEEKVLFSGPNYNYTYTAQFREFVIDSDILRVPFFQDTIDVDKKIQIEDPTYTDIVFRLFNVVTNGVEFGLVTQNRQATSNQLTILRFGDVQEMEITSLEQSGDLFIDFSGVTDTCTLMAFRRFRL